MAASNVDEVLCLLLDHSNRDVVHSVCGVLMNLTADASHRRLLVRSLPRASFRERHAQFIQHRYRQFCPLSRARGGSSL